MIHVQIHPLRGDNSRSNVAIKSDNTLIDSWVMNSTLAGRLRTDKKSIYAPRLKAAIAKAKKCEQSKSLAPTYLSLA